MKWTKENDKKLITLIESGKQYKEISTIMGTSLRSITNRCNRLYIKAHKKNYHENVNCLNCGLEFTSLVSDKQKFCSHTCSASYNTKLRGGMSEETKNKISNTMKNKVKHTSKERPNCLNCGDKVKKNRNKYCSVECVRSSKQFKDKLSEITKKRYQVNPDLHPNRRCANIKETYPEKFFKEFLQQKGLVDGVDFIRQFKIESFYVDFFFPKINLCVEIDGERWHNRSEKEITRENVIKQKYDLIRFKVKPLLKKYHEKDVLTIISGCRLESDGTGLPNQSDKVHTAG